MVKYEPNQLYILDLKSLKPTIDSYLDKIRPYSLLPKKRIGWNYPLDYSFVVKNVPPVDRSSSIVDVGCGPGAIHGYLENQYGVDIVGIDTRRWEKDYVDIEGNFCNPQLLQYHNLDKEFDLILSISSFEHLPFEKHKFAVNFCYEKLAKGGMMIVTTVVSDDPFHKDQDWVLGKRELEEIYNSKINNYDQYYEIHGRYRQNKLISDAYKNRYGHWEPKDPRFLSVGCVLTKE